MDPLSNVLSLLKPRSYLSAGFDAGGEWAVRFDDLAGRIRCYAVTGGACWLTVEGVADPVRLAAGDCFVLPGGRSFTLGSDLGVEPVPASAVFAPARRGGIVTHNGGGVFLVGSRFAVDGRHAAILLRTLPPIVHIEARSDQAALRWSIERMMEELREDRPGASLVSQHLAHMMLEVQALRLHLQQQSAGQVGWFFALSDPRLSAAIGAMHADPAHRWTPGELAARAGMSRSVFAQRLREKVGEAPIEYLARWRMMLAGDRLTTTRDQLAQIAASLGYESESAFSTAFKRVMGCAPRRYARGAASAAGQGRDPGPETDRRPFPRPVRPLSGARPPPSRSQSGVIPPR